MGLPNYDLAPRMCVKCGREFQPKRGGFNARFCAKTCRERVRVKRPYNAGHRKLSFAKTMANPITAAAHLASCRRACGRVRNWLAEYKMSKGCIDCGYAKHYSALQLDHEGPKSESIANCRTSIRRLEEEITNGRCVVRCANCHSIKTWERKQVKCVV